MSNTYPEVDEKVEQYRKENKRSAVMTMIAGLLGLLFIVGCIFIVHNMQDNTNSLEASNDRKEVRITNLENALDAQRSQFLKCIGTSSKASGCTVPVSPKSSNIPGPAGVPGVRGIPGTPGLPGLRGLQGLEGNPGLNGSNGSSGSNGSNGSDGEAGAAGAEGPPGKDGVDGKDGTNGENGKDGVSVTDVSCSGGHFVFTFSDGSQHEAGACVVDLP